MKKRFLIIGLEFIVLWLNCQVPVSGKSGFYIKPYVSPSIILQHRDILGNLIQGYPIVYELNLVKPASGNKLWHLENNLPDIGLNLTVIDYANKRQLGFGIVAAPFVEIPLNKNERIRRLYLRLCVGPAFVTKHFDVEKNQKNYAIGSIYNTYVQFKWFWKIPVNRYLDLEPGLMFNHISNGRAQSPNLGLNVLGIGMAMNIKTVNKNVEWPVKIDSSTVNRKKHEWCVWNAYGVNDGEIHGRKQLVSTWSFEYHYNHRNTHKFGVGFDVYYEENYVKDLQLAGYDAALFDKLRYGPKLCYSYNVGPISFPLEMGCYLRQLTDPDGWLYHRLGVRYYGKKGLMINFGMRSHWAVAYNFDYGIGYRCYIGK